MSKFLNGFLNGLTLGMLRSTPMFGCFNFYNFYPSFTAFPAVSSVFDFNFFRPADFNFEYSNRPLLNQSSFDFSGSDIYNKTTIGFDTFNTKTMNNTPGFDFSSIEGAKPQFKFNFDNVSLSSAQAGNAAGDTKTIETSTKNCTLDDETLEKLQEYLRTREGDGTHTDPDDSGGKTNRGVTHGTYDEYRRQHGLPLQDVSLMTLDEHKKIIKWVWDLSGANKEKNPRMAFYRFALRWGGCSDFSNIVKKSEGDPEKFEQLRRDYYYRISQPGMKNYKFRNGWQNRVTWDKQFAEKYFPNTRVAV